MSLFFLRFRHFKNLLIWSYKEDILYTSVLKNYIYQWEFTGWKDEQLSWKKTCYLHGGLNPSPLINFSGSGAKDFLSKYCVNTFEKFPIGTAKHCIACDEEGYIASDGVVLRTAEEEYETYWMFSLPIAAKEEAGNYDMKVTDRTPGMFLFQVAGPRSLEVLETVTGDDLHDIKFAHFRFSSINGRAVRVLRLGMAGSLAYELHGNIADASDIYDAVYQAGKPFGIRRIGKHVYMMNHAENGFPQFGSHFMMKVPGWPSNLGNVKGSIGPDATGYANPVEMGWKSCIKFDHDFIGRAALEKLVANQTRDMVSLEWDKDDILDIYASRFEMGESYRDIDTVNDNYYQGDIPKLHQDKVLNANGEMIGVSSGRTYTLYYKKMISICCIDLEYAKEGTEVFVLWGEPETRQKKIRATVARFPYFNEYRNQTFDVNTIKRIKTNCNPVLIPAGKAAD
jgi:glycine cleavage system aminomethyltransferase T